MVRRAGVVASFLLATACGKVDTAVGVEYAPDEAGALADASDGPSEAGFACTGDLSTVGAGNFQITLTVATTQTGLVALVNQRVKCAPSVFWDIRMDNGLLRVEVDDVTNYTQIVTTGHPVNDGLSHDLVVRRVSGEVTVYVDGVETGSGGSLASLAGLAPLASGTDACVTMPDGTQAFVGELTNVCVSAE